MTNKAKPYLTLICALIVLLSFTYNDEVKPNIGKLKPNQQQYLLYTKVGQKINILAHLQRTIKDTLINGKPVTLCVQRYDKPGGKVDVDSAFLDKKTLFPVAYHATVGGFNEDFDFSNGRVTGTMATKDSVKHVNELFEAGTYCSVAELELIELLPLRKGFEYSAKLINPGWPVATSTLKVTGEDNLIYAGKPIRCWVMTSQNGANPVATTYWIAKHNQQMIKQLVKLRNGMMWWKIRQTDIP